MHISDCDRLDNYLSATHDGNGYELNKQDLHGISSLTEWQIFNK